MGTMTDTDVSGETVVVPLTTTSPASVAKNSQGELSTKIRESSLNDAESSNEGADEEVAEENLANISNSETLAAKVTCHDKEMEEDNISFSTGSAPEEIDEDIRNQDSNVEEKTAKKSEENEVKKAQEQNSDDEQMGNDDNMSFSSGSAPNDSDLENDQEFQKEQRNVEEESEEEEDDDGTNDEVSTKSYNARQDATNFPDPKNIEVCHSERLSSSVVRSLPHWSFLIMGDIQDTSTWHLPVRGPDGRINLPLLREARMQLHTGKRQGRDVPFKIDSTIESNAKELFKLAWPGLPEVKVAPKLKVDGPVQRARFWPSSKTNWSGETDDLIRSVGIHVSETNANQAGNERKEQKLLDIKPLVTANKTAISLVEKLKQSLQKARGEVEKPTIINKTDKGEAVTKMEMDESDEEDIILDDTDSEDDEVTQVDASVARSAVTTENKASNRKFLLTSLYSQAQNEVATARAREHGFANAAVMEAKRIEEARQLRLRREREEQEAMKRHRQHIEQAARLGEGEDLVNTTQTPIDDEEEAIFSDNDENSVAPSDSNKESNMIVQKSVNEDEFSHEMKVATTEPLQQPIDNDCSVSNTDKSSNALGSNEDQENRTPDQMTPPVSETTMEQNQQVESVAPVNSTQVEESKPVLRTFSRKAKKAAAALRAGNGDNNPVTSIVKNLKAANETEANSEDEKENNNKLNDENSVDEKVFSKEPLSKVASEESVKAADTLTAPELTQPNTVDQQREDTVNGITGVSSLNNTDTKCEATSAEKEEADEDDLFADDEADNSDDDMGSTSNTNEDNDSDEEVEESPVKKRKSSGNAAYRAILEKEARLAARLKNGKSKDYLDNEASEEEEDEAIGNYGDKSIMQNFLLKKKQDDMEEVMHADRLREGDLDGIVDTYSDDEGNDDAADDAHQQFMRERDNKLEAALQRGVETHNFNLLKGKGLTSRVERELGHDSDLDEEDEEEEMARRERRQAIEAEERKAAIAAGKVTGITIDEVDEELERTKEFERENRLLLARRLDSRNVGSKTGGSYRRPLVEDDDSRLIRGMLKRSISMNSNSNLGNFNDLSSNSRTEFGIPHESRDSLFISGASRSQGAIKKRKSFIPFLQSTGDESLDGQNSKSMSGLPGGSQVKSINRSFVYSSTTTPIDVDGEDARMGGDFELPKQISSSSRNAAPRYAPLTKSATTSSGYRSIGSGLSALLVHKRSSTQKRKRF